MTYVTRGIFLHPTQAPHIHSHLCCFLCITYGQAFTVHKGDTRSKFNPNAICPLCIRCGILSSSWRKGEVQQNHATSIADINGLLTYHKRPQSKSGGQLFASLVRGTNKNEPRTKKKNVITILKCRYYPKVNSTWLILEVSLGNWETGIMANLMTQYHLQWLLSVEWRQSRDLLRWTEEHYSGRGRGQFQ